MNSLLIEDPLKKACRIIIKKIINGEAKTIDEINKLKIEVASQLKLKNIPSNADILAYMNNEEKEAFGNLLIRKKTRIISGVTVIAVMTKPYKCPHGKCVYCPGGIEQGTPQSYTGFEPAAMRGWQYNYDPYLQVYNRIKQYEAIGHKVDKIELIIMGGTFPATPLEYQRYFIKNCIDAITGYNSENLNEAIRIAESSKRRISGITVETRPDWAKLNNLNELLEMGVTRIELGVQALSDEIYEIIERKHTLQDVIEATEIAKDLGFKVAYHLMPNLPGSSIEKDIEMFKECFNNQSFRPDMLKIYPTLVIEGTKLYEWWKEGKYKPYSEEELINLLIEWLKMTPRYVRILRLQRDVPSQLIIAGIKKSNLREIVERKMKEEGFECKCIRCREVGHKFLKEGIIPDFENIKLIKTIYDSSNGIDIFLSFEDVKNDILIGFLRLRYPSKILRKELENSTIVRELHVYGSMVPVGEKLKNKDAWQHLGFGSKLLNEAEKISKEEFNAKKIVVISGIGVKEYFLKKGYIKDGPYVSKKLVNI